MTTTNTGMHVIKALEAFSEFGRLTAQEFADYADIGRYDAHAVLNRMSKRTKAGEKRIYVFDWTYDHDDARRYPRAVFMIGDKPDKKKPKPNVKENRRRSEVKRNTTFRMNSVFNMAMTRDKIREIRRSL
jgi:regulatory protein YycH of two-component signal transduction system YycFG